MTCISTGSDRIKTLICFFMNAVNICYLCSLFAYLYFAETVLKSQDTNKTDIKKALANVPKYAPDRVGGGGRRK